MSLRIVVITGEIRSGTQATEVYGDKNAKQVWVLHGPSFDGAGKAAPHFDWVAQAACNGSCTKIRIIYVHIRTLDILRS